MGRRLWAPLALAVPALLLEIPAVSGTVAQAVLRRAVDPTGGEDSGTSAGDQNDVEKVKNSTAATVRERHELEAHIEEIKKNTTKLEQEYSRLNAEYEKRLVNQTDELQNLKSATLAFVAKSLAAQNASQRILIELKNNRTLWAKEEADRNHTIANLNASGQVAEAAANMSEQVAEKARAAEKAQLTASQLAAGLKQSLVQAQVVGDAVGSMSGVEAGARVGRAVGKSLGQQVGTNVGMAKGEHAASQIEASVDLAAAAAKVAAHDEGERLAREIEDDAVAATTIEDEAVAT